MKTRALLGLVVGILAACNVKPTAQLVGTWTRLGKTLRETRIYRPDYSYDLTLYNKTTGAPEVTCTGTYEINWDEVIMDLKTCSDAKYTGGLYSKCLASTTHDDLTLVCQGGSVQLIRVEDI